MWPAFVHCCFVERPHSLFGHRSSDLDIICFKQRFYYELFYNKVDIVNRKIDTSYSNLAAGLFVLIAAILTTPLWRGADVRQDNVTNSAQRTAGPPRSISTLADICHDIYSRPLAQREATAEYYEGTRIETQRVRLVNVRDDVEDSTFILTMMLCDENMPPDMLENRVYCTVRRGLFPQFRGAREDMEFSISGQISDAGSRHIELSDVSLQFE